MGTLMSTSENIMIGKDLVSVIISLMHLVSFNCGFRSKLLGDSEIHGKTNTENFRPDLPPLQARVSRKWGIGHMLGSRLRVVTELLSFLASSLSIQ